MFQQRGQRKLVAVAGLGLVGPRAVNTLWQCMPFDNAFDSL